MEILWTPWRLDYILGAKQPGCPLCQKLHDDVANDPQNLVLHRANHTFVILNLYPYNTAHLMIVPYLHASDLTVLAPEVISEMGLLTQAAIGLIKSTYKPEGFNLGMNLGKVAGAGIDDHLHQHVVPRWAGDVNFMPALAQTHTIPELLPDTYAKLKAKAADFFPAPS